MELISFVEGVVAAMALVMALVMLPGILVLECLVRRQRDRELRKICEALEARIGMLEHWSGGPDDEVDYDA